MAALQERRPSVLMDLAEPWRFISYFMNFSAAA